MRGLVSRRKWSVALVLAVLFGSLGVDRFYLGYRNYGLLKLLTFGGFYVLWVLDILRIATRQLTDADGLPLAD